MSAPTCGCCGRVTTPPTPGTEEEGFYCEGCGTTWADPAAKMPNTCLLHRDAVCPDDGEPLSAHIGGKPCVVGTPSTARTWYDLPMAAAMWSAEGRAIGG